MTLKEMNDGQVAKIVELDMAGIDSSLLIKLTAMGFVSGSSVEVVRRAPMGKGIQLKLRGSDLCLTSALAERVKVA
ncbi:FeoA family protein [Ferrimonas lipolytica]|uniref:Ferrous iron transport protein A n=1 Tax=Ferrimonas lipolytica TaxID=2724191 RepID=A0A6H1UAE5_9GAMM|nr:FeoA family protein [Ferrimonas lipolytica]QIZ76021.1 ferrous iron transport protein A [Ferrimonas lipolytica]